ncbi:hypothetical protein GC105_03580 [Alkalibaculum sp. M08DMB]|uniref:Yip1 domain-containing protein n=1 Tax=Alkalibaculum sporogenes TaxID=2655001 RepID=A0A6A7K620_9FIRM|nr:Yip1 family protein [Alkalibaculum sporogenes]MPW24870.1 hypothetical protein [Alkalibaculum sporogenes]
MEEKQGILERIKLYVVKPSVFFEKHKENPKYLLHLLLLTIIATVSALISNYVDQQVVDDLLNESLSGTSGAEAELFSGILGFMTSPITIFFGTIFITIIAYYLVSLFYYVIVGLIFKGEGKFKHMMTVVLLASYPVRLVGLISSFFTTNLEVNLMKTITGTFNIPNLWQLFLMIIGTSVVFNMSKKKSAIIYIVLFIIGFLFVLGSYYANNALAGIQY